MRYRREDPMKTWEVMKEKFWLKYVPLSFSQQLLDKQNRLTQENKSATDYIAKIDEYLNQYGTVEFESPEQTLSKFRTGLRDDYRQELNARDITTLEHAYQLVTDLDESRGSYFHRTDFRDSSKTDRNYQQTQFQSILSYTEQTYLQFFQCQISQFI